MSITEKQHNDLQSSYQQQTLVIGDDDDANRSLQDWTGYENAFASIKYSTGSEKYNTEVEIDVAWAKIAKLSRQRWSKENPY